MTTLLTHSDALLRGRPFAEDRSAAGRLLRLLQILVLFGFLYGAVMGAYGGFAGERAWQLVYSGVKVPLLLLVSFLLALPSFFVINSMFGLRGDFGRVLHALIGAQVGLTLVLAALAPFTIFWYVHAPAYNLAILFNAAMFAAATFAAHWMLRRSYRLLIARSRHHRTMLRIWMVLYPFVAIQMAWVLRPFIGTPDRPTTFFREEAWGNAYVELAQIVTRALQGM